MKQRGRGKIPMPLRSFVYFPCLPPEIRLQIWELARPDPRIIKVERSKYKYKDIFGQVRGLPICRAEIPRILHACSESRGVGLRWYQLVGTHSWFRDKFEEGPIRSFYIDLMEDYLVSGCDKARCNGVACSNCDAFTECFQGGDRPLVFPKVNKTLVSNAFKGWRPRFHILGMHLPTVTEVMVLDRKSVPISQRTKASELQVCQFLPPPFSPFGVDLSTLYEAERAKGNLDKLTGYTAVKTITCVKWMEERELPRRSSRLAAPKE